MKESGTFRVMNMCRRGSQSARLFQREASARQIAPGHLKVNFAGGFPLADADYRVIYVSEDYDRAVVVSCSLLGGSLAWILSRDPIVDDAEFDQLKGIAESKGFDVSDLVRSVQEGCWSYPHKSDGDIRNELTNFSGAIPDGCAKLPSHVTSFPVEKLEERWHILYTQPDFVENLFSKNCQCNTVTLKKSSSIGYAGAFRSTVACRSKSPTGPRYDFVRPVYEISNLTSYMGHFTQKLYGGLADEHWQILGYGSGQDIVDPKPTEPFDETKLEHMLLYTCLDTRVFGTTYCLHIVSKENKIDDAAVEKYVKLAEEMGIYKKDIMRPVVHGDECIYDPRPSELVLQI